MARPEPAESQFNPGTTVRRGMARKGSASFNRDEVCGGSKQTHLAYVLATAHTEEA